MRISEVLADKLLANCVSLVNVKLYTGAPEANPNTPPTGTLLADWTDEALADIHNSFSKSYTIDNKVRFDYDGAFNGAIDVEGIVGSFVATIEKADTTTWTLTGTVSGLNGGGDMEIANLTSPVTVGQTVRVASLGFIFPSIVKTVV